MHREKPILKTTARDVRVTHCATTKSCLVNSNSAAAFAGAICRRFERLMQFSSEDFTLRRERQHVNILKRSRFHINVRHHLELSPRLERTYRTVERNETAIRQDIRLHNDSAAPIERIVRRLEFQTLRLQGPTGSEGPNITRRPQSALETRSQRPLFTPVEMVNHQPGGRTPVASEPEKRIERAQLRGEHQLMEHNPRPVPIAEINVKQLTDQVVDLLDRRMLASHERLARR